jgi:hypothetical protein
MSDQDTGARTAEADHASAGPMPLNLEEAAAP